MDPWLIESSMKKYSKPVIPSSQYSSIPHLNGSVINIGDWIRKGGSLQPRERALIFEVRPFTGQELNLHINPLCHFLLDLGLQKGDRVSVLLCNGHPFLEIFFALSKIGAILVPLHWRLADPELEFIVKDSGTRMILFDPEFKEVLASIRPHLNLSNGNYMRTGSPRPAWAEKEGGRIQDSKGCGIG